MMYIARILYPVQNLGPGNRLGIWVSGCGRDCPGCANPELRIKKPEHKMSLGTLVRIIHMLPTLPDAVTITGGEPFDQPEGLSELCRWLSANVSLGLHAPSVARAEGQLYRYCAYEYISADRRRIRCCTEQRKSVERLGKPDT